MARRSSSARRLHNGSAPPASAESPANPPARGNSGGGKKSGPWAEPSPAQIERAIRDSALPVVVSLEIATASETEPAPRLPLLECALNSWQELVELQRAVERLERPTREGNGGIEEDALECMVFGSSARPELQLSTRAVDSVLKAATTLVLRLQSLGFSVRSLLKDRVLLRLPANAAPVNTRKIVNWDAIVVAPEATADDDSPEWIQRVMLPPVRLPTDPLSHLHHPGLVPMLDSMLADHASSGRVHVVVLRGIPGSGKSSLGRDVVAICEARGARAVVCSADTYFETPRGYSFNVKAISKAHESSQRLFRETLDEKQASVIVVDNTHTQRWEYEVYEKAALEQGAQVHVFEMHCPDVLTCQRMARRNSHGVSVVKVMAMYLRWDADDRGTLFDASFQDALVLESPVTRNPLKNNIAYVGLFLDATTRAQLLERVRVRHSNVVAEHITLFFRPTTQYIRQAPIGKKFKVRVTSIVEDNKGQTLQVELDDRLPLRCMNKIPHITVSTAQGISAFYSNELLEDPNAKRTQVEDVWELEVTLGIALMAQSRKIVSLASPLQHQFAESARTREDLRSASASTNGAAPGIDSLIVLDVEAADIYPTSETIEHTVLRHALMRHSSGPHAASQRVVTVRNAADSDAKSEAKLLTALHAQLSPSWLPGPLRFDSVVFLKAGETLATMVQQRSDSIKRVTVITTRQGSTVASELNGTGVCVTVKQLPRFSSVDRLGCLAPSLDASLTRTLDAMWISPTEEACFAVQKAIDVAESALSERGVHGATVECLNSALWSLPASVVEITTATAVPECSTDDFVTALKSVGVRDIAVVEDSEATIVLQFQLFTKSSQTPTIRWRVARSESVASSLSNRVEAVAVVRRWLRDSLRSGEHELYSQMAGVVSAVLRGNAKQSTVRNTLNLIAERAVFAFFGSRSSMDVALQEGKYLDHQLLWVRIQDCLSWLAQRTTQQWEGEIGAVMDPTEASAVTEIATHIHSVFQAAGEVVVAGNEANVSESTGAPAWGQKLWSILVLPGMHDS